MNTKLISFIMPLLAVCVTSCASPSPAATRNALPALDFQLGSARAMTKGNTLTVTTGPLTRTWNLTEHGLRTASLASIHGALPRGLGKITTGADWEAEGWIDSSTPAELVSLTARESTDSDFTGKHLEVIAEFNYPNAKTALRYVIWAFPGADGLRTQLWLKNTSTEADAVKAAVLPDFQLLEGKPDGRELSHEKEIVLRVGPLDPAKAYQAAVLAGSASHPTVTLTSIDNESRLELPASPEAAAPVVADLKPELRPNGFVTIRIRDAGGSPPRVAYVRILEAGFPVAEITAESPAATGQNPPKHNAHTKPSHRTDWLPVAPAQLHAIGYFNDTQNRHTPETRLVREETGKRGITDWANILCSESTASGMVNLALVKESHKCVNQTGVDTGAFIAEEAGLAMTGFGLSRTDVRSTEWRWAWANWIIAYPSPTASASIADQRELALKKFQRVRYPVRADLDLYIKANTWGSGFDGASCMARASESEVLAEIDSVTDLGLDELQIDDGWQSGRMKPRQPAAREWIVRPDWYPQGWTNVVDRAAKMNVKLGIWHAARAPLEALQRNYNAGGFKTWKLDFANLSDYAGVQSYLAKGRAFIEYAHHDVRVNWDVTEIEPRFGYFWASECGNLWLANRKPMQPTNVVPKPWLMLREGREIARYLNVNKIELPIQNFEMVNTNISDAHLHSTTYSTALGLAGIPVFFQTTRLLTPEQRDKTKALLDIYKRHRAAMFNAYVFPIGDEPDNKSWTGYQWFDPAKPGEGYLLVFRERLNNEPERAVPLRFLKPGTKLIVQSLLREERSDVTLDTGGAAKLRIGDAGEVLFAKFVME